MVDAPVTLIPVNQLDRAKGRLSTLLDARQRAELALVTLTTAWSAALEVSSAVVILTADLRISSLLGPRAVVLRESPDAHGLNEQLSLATTTLIQERKLREDSCLLILHADLPLATPHAIQALFAAAPPAPSVMIVRSADGGTNAMLQCPPGKLGLAYEPLHVAFGAHELAAEHPDRHRLPHTGLRRAINGAHRVPTDLLEVLIAGDLRDSGVRSGLLQSVSRLIARLSRS